MASDFPRNDDSSETPAIGSSVGAVAVLAASAAVVPLAYAWLRDSEALADAARALSFWFPYLWMHWAHGLTIPFARWAENRGASPRRVLLGNGALLAAIAAAATFAAWGMVAPPDDDDVSANAILAILSGPLPFATLFGMSLLRVWLVDLPDRRAAAAAAAIVAESTPGGG